MSKIKTSIITKSRLTKAGLASIHMKVSVNETDAYFSTGCFVNPTRWKDTGHFKKTKDPYEQEISLQIGLLRQKLQSIANELDSNGEHYNAKMLVNILFKKTKLNYNPYICFDECFSEFERVFLKDNIAQRIQEGQSQAEAKKNAGLSFNKYKSMKSKVIEYLKQEYKVANMPMKKFDDEFQQGFLLFLKSRLSKNTAQRYFLSFNAIFNFSKKKKLIKEYPFCDDFKIRYEKSKTASLTVVELKKMLEQKLSTESLRITRDIFVFFCLTGYSYIDYKKLKRSNIQKIGDKKFIIWNRVKTNVDQNVPLIEEAIKILDRYQNHPDCVAFDSILPIRSAAKLNEYIKVVGSVCAIEKHLTTRVGRKTFGSILNEVGTPLMNISKLIGHANSKTTEANYIDVWTYSLIESMNKYENMLTAA